MSLFTHNLLFVIPAQAGIPFTIRIEFAARLDFRLRGNGNAKNIVL